MTRTAIDDHAPVTHTYRGKTMKPNRSKLNLSTLTILEEAEYLLSPMDIIKKTYKPPVTMSQRVIISNVLKRLTDSRHIDKVKMGKRYRYEINQKGLTLLTQWTK